MRFLIVSALVFLALMMSAARGLGRFGHSHYLPQRQMDRAVLAGDSCFLFLGDSRMVAAFDPKAFHTALRNRDGDHCHVNLAIGAIDIGGIYVTAREYLSHRRVPRVAIIGKVGDSLLGPAVPLLPEEFVGNNAIHLIWSTPGDVYAEVPGFPLASIAAFDSGLRFLVAGSTPFGRYQSLVSAKVHSFQVKYFGGNQLPQNRFGALGDMALLESGLRARAPIRLEEAMREVESGRYGSWFRRLVELLHHLGVPIVVVELPMHKIYQTAVTDTSQAMAYQTWLAHALSREGGSLLDLSRADWVDDHLFIDELHLGSAGAELVSSEIGERVGASLRGSPP